MYLMKDLEVKYIVKYLKSVSVQLVKYDTRNTDVSILCFENV